MSIMIHWYCESHSSYICYIVSSYVYATLCKYAHIAERADLHIILY